MEQTALISILGLTAAFLTTAAYIPQAWRTIRTRDTQSLATGTFMMLMTGCIMWAIYGFCTADVPIIAANCITSLLTGTIFYIKITSSKKHADKS